MPARTVGATPPHQGVAARPVAQAEAALVRHYRRLVRLAYLALPADRDRHSRVLAAHNAVQRALPFRWTRRTEPDVTEADPVYAALRLRVLRAALRPRPAARLTAPRVWGLRLFTPHGGEEDAGLDRVLATLDAPARAAFALRTVDELGPQQAAEVLRRAGVAAPDETVAAAAAVPSAPDPTGPAFDPCAVRVQPTDLLRRRRTLTATLAVGVLGFSTTAAVLGGSGPGATAGAVSASAPGPGDPARLVRVAPDAWQHTTRVDFSAWPARGDRREDGALLGRAVTA
ncbi:hypothetical protein [Kitasatospora sp. NPDC059599]|uniref:hypothetical protein n=1 Tax=Kitasatospora sp. NPDC059599 TaxID=3346880 RepID=UPI0036BBEDD8